MAKKKSILRRIATFFIVLLVLLLLGIGALVACVHFDVVQRSQVDEKVEWLNQKVGLYKLPLVGANQPCEYFLVPVGPAVAEVTPTPAPAPEPKKSREVKISRKELEAQIAAREAAEKKRITKLARIYDNMSPEEAAKALDSVNVDTVALILQRMDESNAGQVLAKMDPLQAAQITQIMFDGQQRRL